MSPEPVVSLTPEAAVAAHPAHRTRFFVWSAALLLALVLAGFARTFFLRPFFAVLAAPWYVYLHGSIVAAWFLLFAVQASLVATGRTQIHRRLGIGGAVLAVAVVAVSLVTVLNLPARVASVDVEGEPAGLILVIIVWLDLAALALFSMFVAAAVYWRRCADVHKRLMLLASIAIIGPATARLSSLLADFPLLAGSFTALPLVLPFALLLHDLLARRRLHPATLAGVALSLALNLAGFAVANSPLGPALIAALE